MTVADTLGRELDAIQEEQKAWVSHNFPLRRQYEAVLGVCEEYFEAQEAQEAMGPAQRNTRTTRSEAWLDAVADCTMYLTDFCTMQGVRSSDALLIGRMLDCESGRPWARHAGRLTKHFLKLTQGIRGTPEFHRAALLNAAGGIFATLERDLERMHVDYAALVRRVWLEVQKRDWKMYPFTGLPEPHIARFSDGVLYESTELRIVEAPGDLCGNTRRLPNGAPCPGCRACC
jgi:hypothetical protein